MKPTKLANIILLIAIAFSAQAKQKSKTFSYQNPIRQGIDTKGLRDCQIFRDGKTWYMTGTAYPHWDRQEKDGQPLNAGVPLYKSTDLTNWQFVKHIVNRPTANKWYYRRFWAPEIHKIGRKYYCTFNCTNPAIGFQGQYLGYAVANQVEGPYTVVTNEKPLANGNDLTFFEDTDKKVWAFWNRGREFGIGYAQIDLQTGKFLTEPTTAIQPGKVDYEYDAAGNIAQEPGYDTRPIPKVKKYHAWDAIGIEGAYVIKHQNTYFLFYSSWTRGYEIGYATAPKITGPWTKHQGDPIYGAQSKAACAKNGFQWTGNPANPFNQVGHNAIFKGPDGRYWLSCHGITNNNESPTLVIDPIQIENGKVQPKEPTHTPQQLKIP